MNIRFASDKDYDARLALLRQLNPEDPETDERLGRQRFASILKANGLSIYLA